MTEKESEKKKNILIIDDEAVNCTILEDYLSTFGDEIFMASNGSEVGGDAGKDFNIKDNK